MQKNSELRLLQRRDNVAYEIQAVVKKYDILFIADEVICAFGRLGYMFGCDKYNIKPDLVSLAKALSSAYMPIGAILVSPEITEVIHSQSNKLGVFSHGFTYSGSPVPCVVALEALKIYHFKTNMTLILSAFIVWLWNVIIPCLHRERNIVDAVNKIAPKFQDGIKAFSDSPIIGEITGVGAYFGAQCEKRGMLVRVAGDSIMMSTPFIISPEEVDELISIYGKALRETEKRVQELKSQRK